LEKNSFKVRNDELMRDLDDVTKNLESLRKLNKDFKEINHKSTQTTAGQQLNKLISTLAQTDFNVRLVAKTHSSHSQTDLPPPPPAPVSVTAPPRPPPATALATASSLSAINQQNAAAQLRKLNEIDDYDQLRKEDYEQLRKEKIELEIKVNELSMEKYLNIKLTDELGKLNKQIEEERKEYEKKIGKLISDFNISKQVSDTIIQQQKKLLHYLQTKLGGKVAVSGADVDENHGISGGASSGSSNGAGGNSGGHNIRNIFKVKKKIILFKI
jgi:hypothetical protein